MDWKEIWAQSVATSSARVQLPYHEKMGFYEYRRNRVKSGDQQQ